MSEKKSIEPAELKVSPFTLLGESWMLLTAGSMKEKNFNTMTVAWGALGTMWHKPLVMVVVRPTRYTYEFMEKYDTFTVTAFPEKHKDKLKFCGSNSGRDTDKIAEAGLTPEPSKTVDAPSFAEADLSIECRKTYFNDFVPENFMADYIAGQYNDDYHRMYFGEVVSVSAAEKYL